MTGHSLPTLALDASNKQDIEQKKADAEGYILYDFIYITFINQTME